MDISTMSRKLYGGRNLNIRTFMHVPTVMKGNNNSLSIGCSPVMFFAYDAKVPYGQQRPKDNSFKVNNRNQFKVMMFFKNILNWFNEPQYQDLFITDEKEGRLMVNMDHRNLNAIVRGSKFDAQVMLAVPTVVTIDSVQHEGVVLSINRTNYSMGLIDSDIEEIYGILNSFSFQSEAQLLLDIASHPNLITTGNPSYVGESRQAVQW